MNINYKMMKQICNSPIKWFAQYGSVVDTPLGMYVYKNNDAPILAVAHLDSVHVRKHFYVVTIDGVTTVYNASMDDRLGAYIILDLLPKFGVKYDLLLTEGEENGQSTAGQFDTAKKYNWMFSFDRHGTDVVMYDYEVKHLKKKLRKSGFKTFDPGLFSDISFLEHLGCRGVNIGTGYYDEHTPFAYANMNETTGNVHNFLQFYNKFKDVPLPYTPTPAEDWKRYGDRDWYRQSGALSNMGRGARCFEWYEDDLDDDENQYLSESDMDSRSLRRSASHATDSAVQIYNGNNIKPYANKCRICHHEYYNVSFIDGVCGGCASAFEQCAGCDGMFKVSEMSTTGFCPRCQHILSM